LNHFIFIWLYEISTWSLWLFLIGYFISFVSPIAHFFCLCSSIGSIQRTIFQSYFTYSTTISSILTSK
jgi:hypothetical protein